MTATDTVAYLAEQETALRDLLREVVEINSYTGNKPGADAVGVVFAREFEALGCTVERHIREDVGDVLVARTHACAHASKSILLCGHMDTVFPPDSGFDAMTGPDANGIIRGPGTYDMKGGIVVALAALQALERTGALAGLPVAMVCNTDEETGSVHSEGVIRAVAEHAAFALVFEGAGKQGQIVTGRKGREGYVLTVRGGAGHAGNLTGPKPSAVLELARKTVALEELNDPERGITVNVGQVSGGMGPNSIAAQAEAHIDTRYVAETDGQALAAAVRAIAAVCRTPGTTAELVTTSLRPGMEESEANLVLANMAETIAGELGIPFGREYRGGVSDANYIAACGVPVLDGLGPVGWDDHSPAEWIDGGSLVQRAALTAELLVRGWERFGLVP